MISTPWEKWRWQWFFDPQKSQWKPWGIQLCIWPFKSQGIEWVNRDTIDRWGVEVFQEDGWFQVRKIPLGDRKWYEKRWKDGESLFRYVYCCCCVNLEVVNRCGCLMLFVHTSISLICWCYIAIKCICTNAPLKFSIDTCRIMWIL